MKANILFETNKLKIEYTFESTLLVDKETGKILIEEDFYGDPTCGYINDQNNIALLCGTHLVLWVNGEVSTIQNEEFKNIHQIKYLGLGEFLILTDPWDEKSAIWKLNCYDVKLEKVAPFTKLFGKPFQNEIEW